MMENRSCGTRKVARWQSANSRISVNAGTSWLDSELGDALGVVVFVIEVHHTWMLFHQVLSSSLYDSVPCVC